MAKNYNVEIDEKAIKVYRDTAALLYYHVDADGRPAEWQMIVLQVMRTTEVLG
jgi:hypothetical protein